MSMQHTMKFCTAVLFALAAGSAGNTVDAAEDRPLFELDGDTFVTFYDLPSRRFHNIRRTFLARDFATASRDLIVSVQYLRVEAQRAAPELNSALLSVADSLMLLSENIGDAAVVVQDFDPAVRPGTLAARAAFPAPGDSQPRCPPLPGSRQLPHRLRTPHGTGDSLVECQNYSRAGAVAGSAAESRRQIAGVSRCPLGGGNETAAECPANVT